MLHEKHCNPPQSLSLARLEEIAHQIDIFGRHAASVDGGVGISGNGRYADILRRIGGSRLARRYRASWAGWCSAAGVRIG